MPLPTCGWPVFLPACFWRTVWDWTVDLLPLFAERTIAAWLWDGRCLLAGAAVTATCKRLDGLDRVDAI